MPRFAFKAKDSRGKVVVGHREAGTPMAVAQELSSTGLLPISIEVDDPIDGEQQRKPFRLFAEKVTLDELILFSRQMHSLTKAGISVVRAVRGLAESQRNETLKASLIDVGDNLEAGTDFATSLRRHPDIYSELFASVIHVGENTGRLDEAFMQIAKYLELERETIKRVKSATRYPTFVIGAIAIAVVILNVFVIPAFAGVFSKYGAELPWQTRAILAVSDFFVAYWPVMLGIAVVGVFGARQYIGTTEGRLVWDRYKLRLPLLGSIFNRIIMGRFCQTFAMASRSGVPITQGLYIVSRALSNEYLADKVSAMRAGIERGSGVAQTANESGMFTPVVLQMISVGEETGSMDDLLEQAAGFYEEEVDYELKGLTDAVEPILIIAIGIMVLILALGVFLPLWDLSSVANK